MLTVNFGTQGCSLLPVGKYPEAKIYFAQERKTKGGEDMLVLGLKTEKGTCMHNMVVPKETYRSAEVTEFMLNQVANLLGLLGIGNTGQVSISEADFIGKEIGISVIHEEFKGVTRAKVGFFFDKKINTTTAEQDAQIAEIAEFPF
jgi:hypothetical protein